MSRLISLLAMAACLALNSHAAPSEFTTKDGRFLLNGQPFQIISGEMHYPRVPRAYWRDRLRMAKAMGLNTVTTYVFWNEHEPRPGVYDFSDGNDIAEFVREAQQEGLYVILRPGPYVCAEWEFGGFPAWLLKDHSLVVRSRDPKFMAAVERWIHRLGQELAPLQIGNGGPIIAVQVENEYGSFGDDHTYMQQMHHLLTESGFNRSLLYTADGPEELSKGSLPGLPVGINFGGSDGPNAARDSFAVLRKFRSEGPSLNSEYWDGWFDHWGGTHATTNMENQAANLAWMLQQGYSVSLYMFHGGTSFGWMNGANSDGKNYEPDVTSYDYDSPLDESGRPTPKYFVFRDLIQKATGVAPPSVPEVPPAITVRPFTLSESVSLWKVLPSPVHSEQPLSMEDLDQSYGYILYRTHIAGAVSGDLVLDKLHDYAEIYVNGKLVGTLDRRLSQNSLHLDLTEVDSRLDILVENSGRVNFTAVLRGERKGITRQVTLAGRPVTGWDIYTLPMTNSSNLAYSNGSCEGACFYRATFDVGKIGDTFLDTGGLSKGQVWLNGKPLGRVWSIGPQKTLYIPGPWLNQGKNEIVVFDLNGRSGLALKGLDKPDLGPTTPAK
jgi:beta-galactosidase